MTVSVTDYEFIRKLVHDQSSIALGAGKEYLVDARLGSVATSEGLGSIGDLVDRLRTGDPHAREVVVNAMATNETSFFRDVHPFDALRETIIPEVLAANGTRHLAMWSAAASTGQEAYSLAMLVREYFPLVPNATILATDFASDVIARAATGTFTQLEVNRGLPVILLVKHFERHGLDWRVKPDVRAMVTCRQINLAGSLDGVRAMDIIFLRNVLIYFDLATKRAVLTGIAQRLRPGGYLFLGASETTYGIDESYERVHVGRTACYRRRKDHE
jgi:chemotaxis protein methyltransferase CheR